MGPRLRERRRTDALGRLRRFLYGVLLLMAAPGAFASGDPGDAARHRAPAVVEAHAPKVLEATLQGLIIVHADEEGDASRSAHADRGYPRIALDTVSARLPVDDEAPLFRVTASEGRALRDGVGFDLPLPELGNLHLNLYTRRNARSAGERIALDDGAAPPPTWSVGGTLELVRTVEGRRAIAVVPELTVDLRDEAIYLPFQASLRLAHWRSLAEKASLDDRVPQMMFRWRL